MGFLWEGLVQDEKISAQKKSTQEILPRGRCTVNTPLPEIHLQAVKNALRKNIEKYLHKWGGRTATPLTVCTCVSTKKTHCPPGFLFFFLFHLWSRFLFVKLKTLSTLKYISFFILTIDTLFCNIL